MAVVVIMDPVAMAAFTSWDGEIGRSFYVIAQQVRVMQIAAAPKKTGRLAASITVGAKNRWAGGIECNVGAGVGSIGGAGTGGRIGGEGYAIYQESGTRRHSITPRDPNGFMTFYWPKVGHVVHFKHVNHPGNKGLHYADRGMIAIISRLH